MSNNLTKPVSSREEFMQQVSNECIYKVQQTLAKAGLSEVEALAVLTSLSKGLADATRQGLKKYANSKNEPSS